MKNNDTTMKMILRASLSFNGRDLELFTMSSPTPILTSPTFKRLCNSFEKVTGIDAISTSYGNSSASLSPQHQTDKHHQAALRLQKVYKSFRTRRRLADCAVLVEQRWWKLMDFAELKRSSISFFDIETHETAVSKWTRATTRAAKVGKGLSKDEKARKLALQHWLEAIDPRHRYGHNLQFYYARWLRCDSKQPFFYWLDIGEGKEVNLEWCSRQKLQQQCIKYLGPVERKTYEVVVVEGKFMYRQSGQLVDTTGGPDEKWIFVLSTSKILYVGKKNKGTFQHSSFLAGGATLSAGRLVVHNGVLKALWPHSGHYLPTEENFQELVSFLKEHNVDLSDVKRSPTVDDQARVLRRQENFPCFSSTTQDTRIYQDAQKPNIAHNTRTSTWSRRLGSEITKLEIPNRIETMSMFKNPSLAVETPSEDGYETADTTFSEEEFKFPKMNLFDQEEAHNVSKETIMQRIDTHKGMRSYQLAQQLTSRWTTGAGPRIGCMRDYPVELQVRVLEESRLSPRGVIVRASTPPRTRFGSMSLISPTRMTPTPLYKDAWPRWGPLSPNLLVEAATP